ncbi:MAG: bifunctional 4-hydroxy-2-oxoglutarate aldolase/2-dehydro-3-deoxy-phosphogluconate aldolase [Actinobacteria bacterium]|nr:bifunctional 4-hydroxy-2-oxoglutarate aldolase/2-dehydro-3-deoxy-phosphogluconate aldolase [Cyanobacteriota bacterium]MCL5770813.1 bifunctional 4-hydroxy-2-oxoglutarate aldolase/2-dehydro-3-deoxy-phosphogluconate aldolase [Actinomycetota bacterium]
MARFDRLTVYNTIFKDGMIPLFYNKDKEEAKKISDALVKGGCHVLEFTNRGEGALEVFSYLINIAPDVFPELIIGAGTIIDAPTAALFIAYGANFIVGPNFNEEIARLCNLKRIPYIPGAATVNEILKAEEFGVELVKIFPGSTIGGPKFVEALLGPCPKTKVMPTGGVSVDEENIKNWFKAGVACIGMGSQLVSKKAMNEKNYKLIETNAAKALEIIRKVRNS